MSSSDSFQFKPITEGLGFHKKVVDLKEEIKQSGALKTEIGQSVPPVPEALIEEDKSLEIEKRVEDLLSKTPGTDFIESISPQKEEKPVIKQALPRESEEIPVYQPRNYSSVPTVDKVEPKIVREQPEKLKKQEYEEISFGQQLPEIKETPKASVYLNTELKLSYKESPVHLGAGFFDMIVIAGMTCLFGVGLMIGADIDLFAVFTSMKGDVTAQVGFGVLVFSIIELYMIITRSIFGNTLGEWAFDIQLGTKQEQKSAWYPVFVTWRTIVVALTGFVLLPIISLITRKDETSRISGLRLYRVQ
jgi:hypothetical protein